MSGKPCGENDGTLMTMRISIRSLRTRRTTRMSSVRSRSLSRRKRAELRRSRSHCSILSSPSWLTTNTASLNLAGWSWCRKSSLPLTAIRRMKRAQRLKRCRKASRKSRYSAPDGSQRSASPVPFPSCSFSARSAFYRGVNRLQFSSCRVAILPSYIVEHETGDLGLLGPPTKFTTLRKVS